MLSQIYFGIYWTDLWLAAALLAAAVLIWALLNALFMKKLRIVSAVAAVIAVVLILTVTVFARGSVTVGCEFIPFSMLLSSFGDKYLFRSVVMNVFLFVPLGMTLPFAFKASAALRIGYTLLLGFILSAAVELMQLILQAGMTQTDDVICNTLGTAIGAVAYPLSLLWQRLLRKGGHRRSS